MGLDRHLIFKDCYHTDITFFTASLDAKQFDRRTKCMKYLKTHRKNLYKDEIAHTNFKKKDAERKKKERLMKKLYLSERDVEKIRTKERERKRRQRAEKKKLVALCRRLWVHVNICFKKCS